MESLQLLPVFLHRQQTGPQAMALSPQAPWRPLTALFVPIFLINMWSGCVQVSATTVHRRALPENKWERFGGSAYLFALDPDRAVDTNWAAASVICRSMGATLVAINGEEELNFLKERIRSLVESQGQKFAGEQWWTGGRRKDGTWVWEMSDEAREKPIAMEIEAESAPVRHGEVHHALVLEHVPSQWKLRTLPETYDLRYICEKGDPNGIYPVLYPPADTVIDPNARPVEERMLRTMFREYDPDARGNRKSDATVTVTLQFVLLRIQDLDEKNMVLTTMGMIVAEWRDDRLSWNPLEFDNITSVVVRADRLWLPELAVINGAEETIMEDFTKIRAIVYYDGRVHWEPGGNFRTTCDINIYYFPFDRQHCEINIGAWVYHSAKMNVTNVSSDVNTDNYTLNGEWELLSTSVRWGEAELNCCPGTSYAHVKFSFELRRRNVFYVVNIIAPCVLLSALVLAVFWVPPDEGERLSAGISVLLSFIVFLIMIADTVPRTSLHVPVLIMYLTCIMTLVALSICWTVLIINIHYRCKEKPLPRWTRRFLLLRRKRNNYRNYDNGSSTNDMCVSEANNDVLFEKPRVIKDVRIGESLKKRPGVSFKEPGPIDHTNPDMQEASLRVPLKNETSPCLRSEAQLLEESREIVTILDRLFFVFMFLAMLLSSFFILFLPWYTATHGGE